MTIAVHISAVRQEDLRENFNFICFSQLAIHQPDNHYIFIFDNAPHPEMYLEKNCTPVVLPPIIKNNLLRHYWYNYKLPTIIQRYNPDVFITDRASCSLRLTIPQCMVVNGEQLMSAEKNVYFKRFLPAFVQKSAHIFCIDEQALDRLNSRLAEGSKASLIHPGLKSERSLLTDEEREAIKEEYTKGNEYFYYTTTNIDTEEAKVILKAFSIFKKWQKSSMQMVLSVSLKAEALLLKELRLYKHREDVIVITEQALSEKLLSASYALFVKRADARERIIAALKSEVPVVIDEEADPKKIFPTVLPVKWDDKSISEKMMVLYKDESFRKECIERGISDSEKYSWDLTSEKIWAILATLKL